MADASDQHDGPPAGGQVDGPRGGRAGNQDRNQSMWPRATEDRQRLGPWATVAIAVLLGMSFRLALGTLPLVERGRVFVDAAVLTAVLAVLALRSLPLRWVVRTYALIGGVLLMRFGFLREGTGLVAARDVLAWGFVTAAALALCPSPRRAGTPARTPGAPGSSAGPGSGTGDRASRPSTGAALARAAVAAAVLVGAVLLLVGPLMGNRSPVAPSNGDAPNPFESGRDNAMTVQQKLDMTTRPRLSDTVVMTVRSGLASFWRNATYDEWDGRTWTNSDGGGYRFLIDGSSVEPSPDDLAATTGDDSRQEFRLETGFANALPIAPSAVRVTGTDARLLQRPDGSIVAPDARGKGATYTVESRQVPVTAARLEGLTGAAPEDVSSRYAAPARTTAGVGGRARGIVADAGVADGTTYAKVQAIEAWMGGHLKYSLDAPLAPEGVDVVDDFLFESKEGWCEQIASSLVVMLREVGVPVRLATGYAPGERDDANGRFIVRERDAHAWAEVWFPEVGWVPFDPTAHVPLAGDADATSSDLPIGLAAVAVLLLFVGAVVLLAVPLARRLHRWRERRAARRSAARLAAERWDVRAERDLEARGVEVGRPRSLDETVSAHARELTAITGDDELARVGAAVDDHRYRPPGTSSSSGTGPA